MSGEALYLASTVHDHDTRWWWWWRLIDWLTDWLIDWLRLHVSRLCKCIISLILTIEDVDTRGISHETQTLVMRPSSLGGGRILHHTLSVCPSVCLSVCLSVRPVRPVLERHLAPHSELQWHTEGRITYGHLGRTNLLNLWFGIYMVYTYRALFSDIICSSRLCLRFQFQG